MADLVLVSGGSGGIGGAVCRALATRGLTPVVGYAGHGDRAEKVAVESDGWALALDLADDAQIAAAVDRLAECGQPLAAVVLAGSPPPSVGPFGRVEAEEAARQWRINVEGPRQLLAGVIKQCFRPRKQGRVIGVLSSAMGASDGPAASSMAGYVIAKFGQKGLLAAVAGEFPWLVTGAVSPGYTETDMLTCFDDRFLEAMRARQPEGRFAKPEEVAAEIVDLVVG